MLSHLDDQNRPRMVDVGEKIVTTRHAHARATVHLPAVLAAHLNANEIIGKKGPIFQTASLAGTMAAKRTSDLIPLCHPLPLENCQVTLEAQPPAADGSVAVHIDCHTRVTAKTGVEMEALTGATIAALTLYDMGKAVTHDIVIRDIRLIAKTGGKSDYSAPAPAAS